MFTNTYYQDHEESMPDDVAALLCRDVSLYVYILWTTYHHLSLLLSDAVIPSPNSTVTFFSIHIHGIQSTITTDDPKL